MPFTNQPVRSSITSTADTECRASNEPTVQHYFGNFKPLLTTACSSTEQNQQSDIAAEETVINLLCFLLGNSLASEFYMQRFGTLSVPSS
jgi:hypothetical protein